MTTGLKKIFLFPGMIVYYLFLTSGFYLFTLQKGEVLVWLNGQHSPFLDRSFMYLTFLGDGAIMAILLLICLFVNYYAALLTAISIIIQTIIVQALKNFVFGDMVRPARYFPHFSDFHMVPGVELHHYHSFPSGHAATAFTMALLLSLFSRNKNWSLLYFVLALTVGLSRIYLLQHFFTDVYAGSLIGIITVLLSLLAIRLAGIENRGVWRGSLLRRP